MLRKEHESLVARLRAKVPTAAGELAVAVLALGDVVERLAIATGQGKDPEVETGLDLCAEHLTAALAELLEKLPDRPVGPN